MTLKVMLVAIETSADQIGAALYQELNARLPGEIEFYGCGGEAMATAGFKSLFPIDSFSVIGPTGVLKVLPEAFRRAAQLVNLCKEEEIDLAVFIDGWTFSRVCAKRIKNQAPHTKTVKYSAPQVWASRPHRVKYVKQYFDALLTLLPFEAKYFEPHGIRTEFVGNPNYQEAMQQIDAASAHMSPGDASKTLAVLPGSRKAEVRHLSPAFVDIINALQAEDANLRVLVPVAPSVSELVQESFAGIKGAVEYLAPDQRYAAFKQADAALAASGTVTTELALARTPMIVAYKLDAFSAMWLRRLMISDYASIINIAAEREIIPEFIQEDVTPEKLLPAVRAVLYDEKTRQAQLDGFEDILKALDIDGPPATAKAAAAILKIAGR